MKRFILIALVSMLGIAIYSCTQSDETLTDSVLETSECNGWNEIGQLHNDGLDVLFERLRLEEKDSRTYETTSQITEEVALNFYNEIQSNISPPHYPISFELHTEIVQTSRENVEIFFDGSAAELHDFFVSLGAEKEVANNVLAILNIFENQEFNNSYSSLKMELDNLKSDLEGLDKWNYVLDDTYNVALASYCYWDTNTAKWMNEFSLPNSLAARDALIRTGRADLVGAAYGAFTGDGPGAVGGALTASGLRLLSIVFWG